MGNFFKGLVVGILGAVLWILASVVAALAAVGEDTDSLFASPVAGAFVIVGFLTMVGGPIVFWIAAPIVAVARRPHQSPVVACQHTPGRFCTKCGAPAAPRVTH